MVQATREQCVKNSDPGRRIEIIGGGLAGRLTLVALKARWPDCDVKIVRPKSALASNHTWCFHESDLKPSSMKWLAPYISKSWDGYDVRFPHHRSAGGAWTRTLSTGYHAIRSDDFFEKTERDFASSFIEAASVSSDAVVTIVATGWPKLHSETSHFGWQKFVGMDLTLKKPHGLKRPVLKDATVPQTDGYRFFYSLPWTETSLLVEDTYYSNESKINVENSRAEILRYAATQGWEVETVERVESGSLPLEFLSPRGTGETRPMDDVWREYPNALAIGAASGLAHPVTGYTTSIVFRQIEALIEIREKKDGDFRERLSQVNSEIDKSFSYFHLLNRMLFLAAVPSERYRVLQRFYTLSPGLIARFYSATLTRTDQMRILVGRPPVPMLAAVREFRNWL